MRADRFTIREVPKRLTQQHDPWADMARHARSLDGPIKRVARLRA
jgi:bifunctional non-homologous end joining protein LigD